MVQVSIKSITYQKFYQNKLRTVLKFRQQKMNMREFGQNKLNVIQNLLSKLTNRFLK